MIQLIDFKVELIFALNFFIDFIKHLHLYVQHNSMLLLLKTHLCVPQNSICLLLRTLHFLTKWQLQSHWENFLMCSTNYTNSAVLVVMFFLQWWIYFPGNCISL